MIRPKKPQKSVFLSCDQTQHTFDKAGNTKGLGDIADWMSRIIAGNKNTVKKNAQTTPIATILPKPYIAGALLKLRLKTP